MLNNTSDYVDNQNIDNTGKLLVYKSSAGSGKTTQLVIEYLDIVIRQPKSFRHILAITFTNKAAEEMKGRIVSALHQIALAEDFTSIEYLIKPLLNSGLTFDEIKENAAVVMKNILHDYSNFAISTIDSLMHRIIRGVAFEFNLSYRFEVIMDGGSFVKQAVDDILDELSPNHPVTHFLTQQMKHLANEGKSTNIENSLYQMGLSLLSDESLDILPLINELKLEHFEEIEQVIRRRTVIFENYITKQAQSAFEVIGDIPCDAFAYGKNGICSYFNKLIRKDYKKEGVQDLLPSQRQLNFFEGEKHTSSKKELISLYGDAILNIVPQLQEIYQNIKAFVEKKYQQYFLDILLLENLFSMGILVEINQALQQLKKENDYVFISDFNKKISEQLQRHSAVPFIYERIGEKYTHCFIDEFQDTSILQWHNLLPLVANGLSYDKKNMLVGDAKQSIYRFRGGEAEQFYRLPHIFKAEQLAEKEMYSRTLQHHFHEKLLNKNYRSSKTIVDFNNAYFEYIYQRSGNEYFQKIYENHNQIPFSKDEGKVNVTFVEGKGSELLENRLQKTEEAIKDCLKSGYQLKNIAVLCDRNSEGAAVASFLTLLGYDVISSDSLLLADSTTLNFLFAVLNLLLNPQHEEAQLSIVTFLYKKEASEKLSFHDWLIKNELFNATASSNNYQYMLFNRLGYDAEKWSTLGLYEKLENIIQSFDLQKNTDSYVLRFLEEVHQLIHREQMDEYGLLDWWEEKKDKVSLQIPQGDDAIQIITIHKSKGLEYPVVILPFYHHSLNNKPNYNWIDLQDNEDYNLLKTAQIKFKKMVQSTVYANQYQEERNKVFIDDMNRVYVAFTRPKNRLYIVSDFPPKIETENNIPYLYHFVSEHENFDVENMQITFGGDVKQKSDKEEKKADFLLQNIVNTHWKSKMSIAKQRKAWWQLSDENQQQNEAAWGTLVHEILSEIYTLEDLPLVLNSYVLTGKITETYFEQLKTDLHNLITDRQLQYLFSDTSTVYNEQSIITQQGKLVRPDKIVVIEDATYVVDFKTGSPQDSHQQQMEMYAGCLKEMGYENVKPLLIYIKPHQNPELVWI